MLKKTLLTLLLVFLIRNSSCFMDDIWTVVKDLSKLMRLAETIDGTADRYKVYEAFRGEIGGSLLADHFQKMQGELLTISNDQEFKFDALGRSLLGISEGEERMLFHEHREIALFIMIIDEKYDDLLNWLTTHKTTVEVLNDFTYIFLLRNEVKINDTREMMLPPGDIPLLNVGPIIPIANGSVHIIDNQCGANQTLQNLMVTVFKMVMETEVKTFIIRTFSHRYHYNTGDEWKSRLHGLRKEMKEQFEKYLRAFSNSLRAIDSSYLRSCDPDNNSLIQSETFYELDGYSQKVIFHYSPQQCLYTTCDSMWINWRDACGVRWYDNRTRCNGQVTGCEWLGDMKACVLKEGPHSYQWVSSSGKGIQGRGHDKCPKDNGYIIKTTEGLSSSCMCNCREEKAAVYLGKLKSRRRLNYVVTGLRFKLNKDNILFLQPAEGRLEANGYISNSSWIRLPEVVNEQDIGKLDSNYHSIFLDDLRLPASYVMTGARFRPTERGRNTKIKGYSIKIIGVPFDYKTGELSKFPAYKKTASAGILNIEKELPYKLKNPTYVKDSNLNQPSPKSYTYVTIKQANLQDDFSQSTLPLFDTNPILISPLSPLGGVGIFHKGSAEHAGFISLRLYSINYVSYVNDFLDSYRNNKTAIWYA